MELNAVRAAGQPASNPQLDGAGGPPAPPAHQPAAFFIRWVVEIRSWTGRQGQGEVARVLRGHNAGMSPLRLGTRASALAVAQAEQISAALAGAEIVRVRTDDGAVGDKARFVRGVERALLEGEVDLGVHSAKDLPGELPEGLVIAAVPGREESADAYVGSAASLGEVPRELGSDPQACGAGPSSWRCARTLRSSSCAGTSTPAWRSSRRAPSTGSCWPPPACDDWGERRRSRSCSRRAR